MKGLVKIGNNSSAVLAALSIVMAMMSLGASFYQSYLFTRQVDLMQRNVARGEYMRTCKEAIDAYFQVKMRTGLVARLADRKEGPPAGTLGLELANAVSRFQALGTYLANFQNEDTRYQYTQLSEELERIVAVAPNTAPADLKALFDPADKLFAGMNDDCVRRARSAPL